MPLGSSTGLPSDMGIMAMAVIVVLLDTTTDDFGDNDDDNDDIDDDENLGGANVGDDDDDGAITVVDRLLLLLLPPPPPAVVVVGLMHFRPLLRQRSQLGKFSSHFRCRSLLETNQPKQAMTKSGGLGCMLRKGGFWVSSLTCIRNSHVWSDLETFECAFSFPLPSLLLPSWAVPWLLGLVFSEINSPLHTLFSLMSQIYMGETKLFSPLYLLLAPGNPFS